MQAHSLCLVQARIPYFSFTARRTRMFYTTATQLLRYKISPSRNVVRSKTTRPEGTEIGLWWTTVTTHVMSLCFGWECATQSWKLLPYFRPKYKICDFPYPISDPVRCGNFGVYGVRDFVTPQTMCDFFLRYATFIKAICVNTLSVEFGFRSREG